MPCNCKGKCAGLPNSTSGLNGGRYLTHKLCVVCGVWHLKPCDIRCMCCNQRLRDKARSSTIRKNTVFTRM